MISWNLAPSSPCFPSARYNCFLKPVSPSSSIGATYIFFNAIYFCELKKNNRLNFKDEGSAAWKALQYQCKMLNIRFQKISETVIEVDSSYKLTDLEKYYNIQIKEIMDEEIDTVGGLVFFLAGKVPKKTETFQYNNFLKFKILSASDRRINILEIEKI